MNTDYKVSISPIAKANIREAITYYKPVVHLGNINF